MSYLLLLSGQAYSRIPGADSDRSGHGLAWMHVLSRVTVALFALSSSLPTSLAFRGLREDSSGQSFIFRYVSTPTGLVAAVEDGVKHIVVTQHLDLTELSKQLSTLTAGVIETTSTATIQGMCDSVPLEPTEQPLPSKQACVLDVHEDFLEASNSTQALLLSHLYVRLRGTGRRSTANLILNKARSLYLSYVALQGNSVAVRGMDIYENSRVYIADSSMHNFARSFGSAIKLRTNVTAALESVSFAYNTIITEPGQEQQYGPDLYVGALSTAVLRNISMSEVLGSGAAPPAPVPASGGDDRFEQVQPAGEVTVAKLNDRASVRADRESAVTVYEVKTESVIPAEVEMGTPRESVLTMDDEWYTNIMAEWKDLVESHPYFSAGEEDALALVEDDGDEVRDDGSEVEAGSGVGPSVLDNASRQSDGDNGMPSLVVIMVALAVGAALVIFLSMVAFWVYRKVQTKKQQELAVKRRRERLRSDGGTEMTGSMAFTSGPLQQTPSQASTTHTRSKSFGVFSTGGMGGVPQQPDSARNERSTGFTRTGSLQSLPSCTTTIPVPAMILTNQRMGNGGQGVDGVAAPNTPASRSSPTRRPGTASSALTPIPGGSPHGTSPKGAAHNIRSASTSSSSISNSIQLQTPSGGGAGSVGNRSDGAPVRTASNAMLRRTSEAAGSAHATECSSAPFGDAELMAALDAVTAGGPQAAGWLYGGRYTPLGPDQRRVSGSGVVQFAIAQGSGAHVALKFFARRAAFLRTEALYKHSTLREYMPHIVAIEANSHDDDSVEQSAMVADAAEYTFPPCIVMERGECLRDWAVLRRPDFEQRLQVLAVVAERVSAIHAAGFGHRNLKPENILFRPRDQTWRLIDFANAARLGTRASLPKSLLYAPPEWVHATESHSTMVPADPAADIWAFGVTVYELITGHPMFPPNAAAVDVRDALAGRTPLPWEHPSAIGDMGPSVFREFGALRRTLRSCLSRKASHRPNAEALVQELYGKLSALRRSGSSSPARSRSSQR